MAKKDREKSAYQKILLSKYDADLRSAQVVLGLIYKFYQPHSVVEFSSGLGAWLAAAESLGSHELSGFYENPFQTDKLPARSIRFQQVDFGKDIQLDQRFDLALSLETAEHLPQDRAIPFIKMLCRSSDVILFSAATPRQGGFNHTNEQLQSYWIGLFSSQGYECFDAVRASVWNDPDVLYYYRQNTFLFVRQGVNRIDPAFLISMQAPIFDVIHPDNFDKKFSQYIQNPSLRTCLSVLKHYFLNRLGVRTMRLP